MKAEIEMKEGREVGVRATNVDPIEKVRAASLTARPQTKNGPSDRPAISDEDLHAVAIGLQRIDVIERIARPSRSRYRRSR
jgi:hypothetical protein